MWDTRIVIDHLKNSVALKSIMTESIFINSYDTLQLSATFENNLFSLIFCTVEAESFRFIRKVPNDSYLSCWYR